MTLLVYEVLNFQVYDLQKNCQFLSEEGEELLSCNISEKIVKAAKAPIKCEEFLHRNSFSHFFQQNI